MSDNATRAVCKRVHQTGSCSLKDNINGGREVMKSVWMDESQMNETREAREIQLSS